MDDDPVAQVDRLWAFHDREALGFRYCQKRDVGDAKEELVGVHSRDASRKSDEGDKARIGEAGVGMARDKGVIVKDDVGEKGVVVVSDGDGGGDDRV